MSAKPPLTTVGPGDQMPRDLTTWNAMIGAGLEHLRSRPGFSAPELPGGPTVPHCLVLVRNDTGGSLPVFSVVKLGTPLVSAVDYPHQVRRLPVFPGTAPSAATDCFAITIEPATTTSPGNFARAIILGAAVVDLIVNDNLHQYAAPLAATTAALNSQVGYGPAKIIWKNGSAGTVRAVVLLQGNAGISGSGSPPAAAIWADANTLTYGPLTISPSTGDVVTPGQVQVTDSEGTITMTPGGESSLAYPYLHIYVPGGSGNRYWFYGDGSRAGVALPYTQHFVLTHNADDPSLASASCYAVDRGTFGGPSIHVGVDGTLAPGATFVGGICTSVGSGSFVGTSTPNTFTAAQTIHPSTDVVPITVQGGGTGTADLTDWKATGGSIVASMSAAGAMTALSFAGDGSALTSLNASQLTSGTVPDARLSNRVLSAVNLASFLTNY